MKKIKKLLWCTLAGVFALAGCASNRTVKAEKIEPVTSGDSDTVFFEKVGDINRPLRINHSFLTEEHIGSSVTITGILGGSLEEGYYIMENADSRSRVTFVLEEDPDALDVYSFLDAFEGQVTVTGVLTGVSSPWKKTMTVLNVE